MSALHRALRSAGHYSPAAQRIAYLATRDERYRALAGLWRHERQIAKAVESESVAKWAMLIAKFDRAFETIGMGSSATYRAARIL